MCLKDKDNKVQHFTNKMHVVENVNFTAFKSSGLKMRDNVPLRLFRICHSNLANSMATVKLQQD